MVRIRHLTNLLAEFSIPLLAGVAVALVAANAAPDWYHHAVHWEPLGHGASVFGHHLTLHFLVNDLFMVLFFGIAAKEITESCLPGGSLNPIRKAMNPLVATAGGVLGPVAVFFAGYTLFGSALPEGASRGWGIPTATDIALAWMVARAVFGKGHPAIDFLLLLAIADDAVGLGIIALFYGDPANPVHPEMLGFVGAAMAMAFAMRRMGVNNWVPYVAFAGPVAWYGLLSAHLHPALALVAVVPFIPGPKSDTGLFVDEDEVDLHGGHGEHSPLHAFEQQLKPIVDFGLFFFAFANAGVPLSGVGTMTGLILGSLVIGKTLGVSLASLAASAVGFPLPQGMSRTDLFMAGFIGALGLTVALFVADAAFDAGALQGEAKMGALMSGFVGLAAVGIARALGMGAPAPSDRPQGAQSTTEPAADRVHEPV